MSLPKFARRRIKWTIRNFTQNFLDGIQIGKGLYQEFTIELNGNITKWKIMFRPKSYGKELNEYVACYLVFLHPSLLITSTNMNIFVTYEFELSVGDKILIQRGSEQNSHKIERFILGYGWSKFMKIQDLIKQCNGEFSITAYVQLMSDSPLEPTPASSVLKDMEQLFEGKTFADFTFITSCDNKKILVNKCIISARCLVFAGMLNSEMREAIDNESLVDDVNGKVMTELLRFIYCEKVNDLDTIAGELLYAADKYGIKKLKNLCIHSLMKNVNSNNAIKTLAIACTHQHEELKKNCIDFIQQKYEKLKDSKDWSQIENAMWREIMSIVIEKLNQTSQIDV